MQPESLYVFTSEQLWMLVGQTMNPIDLYNICPDVDLCDGKEREVSSNKAVTQT